MGWARWQSSRMTNNSFSPGVGTRKKRGKMGVKFGEALGFVSLKVIGGRRGGRWRREGTSRDCGVVFLRVIGGYAETIHFSVPGAVAHSQMTLSRVAVISRRGHFA